MLSILIPTYNYNVVPLVTALQKQCLDSAVPFEIIVTDDGSGTETALQNTVINTFKNCRFIALPQNIGLSENRNTLAREARYENLLFIDGDSIIISPDFVADYLNSINGTVVVYGGRIHPENVHFENQRLRWKYGRLIEDKTAGERKKNVYRSLLFNNALIKKSSFNQIKFDPELRQYGHEDTLFAYQAGLLHLKVKHIDNPVEHGDIDDSAVFIKKIKMGLDNIMGLYNKGKIDSHFVRIMQLYHTFKKIHLVKPVGWFYKMFNAAMHKNLVSGNPSLLVFNIYRITYLCTIKP